MGSLEYGINDCVKPATEQQIKEAFAFFASNGTEIAKDHILAAVRALGLPVTAAQIKQIMFPSNENDENAKEKDNENEKENANEINQHSNTIDSENDLLAVNYPMFYDLLLRVVEKRKPDNLNNEIRKAFENLKDSEGKVLKRYLRNLLQNTGEKLSTEE
ncbi:hypothetical protein RFI_12556, partial [Reticulomyxa filosa]